MTSVLIKYFIVGSHEFWICVKTSGTKYLHKSKNTKQAHAQSAQFYKQRNPIWKFSL